MECIDTFNDLDLLQTVDGHFVQLAGDPSMGASLLFAHLEGYMEGNHNETHTFTPSEQDQIDDWFEEYEAA